MAVNPIFHHFFNKLPIFMVTRTPVESTRPAAIEFVNESAELSGLLKIE